MKLEQAARQALEALEQWKEHDAWHKRNDWNDEDESAITALREALAEPKKPEECAKRCPPFQVCDYCQKAEQADNSGDITNLVKAAVLAERDKALEAARTVGGEFFVEFEKVYLK